MSSGPRTQAGVIQENQNKVEHDASHSALFYLLQEVSMLASPMHHNSFLDTNPPSRRPNDTPRKDPLVVKTEEDARSFQTSSAFCRHNLSWMLPYDQVKEVEEESHSAAATTLAEPHCECNSPWKVLSLINLHCERLLHQSDAEELDPSSASAKSGQLTAKLSTAAPDVTEKGVRSDSVSVQCMLNERQDTASVSPGTGHQIQYGIKDSEMDCSVEKTDTAGSELLEDNATASLQSQQRNKTEVKFNFNEQLVWRQEWKKNEDILDVPFSENAVFQTHIPSAFLNAQLTFNRNSEVCVALPKPALTLDHNANLTLSTEAPCGTQQPPLSAVQPSSRSASLICSTAESRHSLSTRENKITASKLECTHAAVEEKSPSAAQLKSSSYNVSSAPSKPELWTLQKEEKDLPSTRQWRTKTPRKQPHPCRSADSQDPDFQGVTFRMDRELDDSREQCRLLITSKYSKELCKSVRKPRLRTRTSQKSLKTSSSDEENDLTTNVLKGKVCASCCTRKTPMWRDAEDGTPLCNACGIRYKKYRVRCVNCWHIPRKEGNSNSCCLKCGNFVRLTSAQRKHTT